MASDPTDISHASEPIVGVDVKDILDSEGDAEEVATGGMNRAYSHLHPYYTHQPTLLKPRG